MANSDAANLEALKTARDAIVAGIAAGDLTVTYTVRGRSHTVADPVKALQNLEDVIARYELKTTRATRSPFRVAKLRPAGRSG